MLENIPACLRELPQWVCWKYVERGSKRTKVPVSAATGALASSTDQTTWSTFDEAAEAYSRCGHAGVGFVFTSEDPYCGIDLDDCLDAEGRVIWGGDILSVFDTYTETSPSGKGLKLVFRARKPEAARSRIRFTHGHSVELYDQGRFFALTGQVFPELPAGVCERQEALDAFLTTYGNTTLETKPARVSQQTADQHHLHECLRKILAMRIADRSDGSYRLYSAACRCVEHDLSDAEAIQCLRAYEQACPFPVRWSDEQLLARLRDAERAIQRGASESISQPADIITIPSLLTGHPSLRSPLIHGVLRTGESLNVIAAAKTGKSWLTMDLAMAVATGRPWLDLFPTVQGEVLLIDNELHPETLAHRIPKVAEARGISMEEIGDQMSVMCLRGKLMDLYQLSERLESLEPGRLRLIVIDAFYRVLPRDTDENSNGEVASLYNIIDKLAAHLRCGFCLVHHSSKGNQSMKSITDVGAGAGSQSRAADTHLILRPHEEPDCVVLDAAVRSWTPMLPRALRWEFPVWNVDDSLDPTLLRSDRPRKREATAPKETKETWRASTFVERLVTREPKTSAALVEAALEVGLSERRAEVLLRRAEEMGLIFRWQLAPRTTAFATIAQPAPTAPAVAPAEKVTKREMVKSLLTETELTSAEIASRTSASERFVREIRKELRAELERNKRRNCAA